MYDNEENSSSLSTGNIIGIILTVVVSLAVSIPILSQLPDALSGANTTADMSIGHLPEENTEVHQTPIIASDTYKNTNDGSYYDIGIGLAAVFVILIFGAVYYLKRRKLK